ncbi:hypothetical protein KSP39_PZI006742 [Platanthera zijinensis]|uniref:Uncharacterized protein n=1 Tax=Platanthera zijinensis TaxID=2320716 RepID=A0AAP0BRG8_9ASPA
MFEEVESEAATPNPGPYFSRFPVSSPLQFAKKKAVEASSLPIPLPISLLSLSLDLPSLSSALPGRRKRTPPPRSLSRSVRGAASFPLSRSTSLSHDLSLSRVSCVDWKEEEDISPSSLLLLEAPASPFEKSLSFCLLGRRWLKGRGAVLCRSRCLKRALLKSTVESRFGAQIGV